MKPQNFSLQPFPGEEIGLDLQIHGTIGRRGNIVSLACELLGTLSGLSIPAPARLPGRRACLWEETCLELFLGEYGSKRYWEFNLSPAGHWNVYRFTSYRKEMREETEFSSLPLSIRTGPGTLRLSLDLNMETILPPGMAIEVGVSAVLRTVEGRSSHWALTHPGPRPDFHRRDGFPLKIPGP